MVWPALGELSYRRGVSGTPHADPTLPLPRSRGETHHEHLAHRRCRFFLTYSPGAVLLTGSIWIRVLPAAVSRRAGLDGGTGPSSRCEWTLDSYTSSPWEREWLEAGQARGNIICQVLWACGPAYECMYRASVDSAATRERSRDLQPAAALPRRSASCNTSQHLLVARVDLRWIWSWPGLLCCRHAASRDGQFCWGRHNGCSLPILAA